MRYQSIGFCLDDDGVKNGDDWFFVIFQPGVLKKFDEDTLLTISIWRNCIKWGMNEGTPRGNSNGNVKSVLWMSIMFQTLFVYYTIFLVTELKWSFPIESIWRWFVLIFLQFIFAFKCEIGYSLFFSN